MGLISAERLLAPLRQGAGRQWHALAAAMRRGRRIENPQLRDEAATLARDVLTFLQLSDPRAVRARAGLDAMILPPGTDWRWRPPMFCGPATPPVLVAPDSGRRLGDEISLWHDCPHRALILRQWPNRRATDLAAFGLRLEVMGFAGSYLSLSLDLPDTTLQELGPDHVLRLEVVLQAERPVTVYGRVNLQQGPNTAQMLRQLGEPIGVDPAHRVVEFDLAHADLTPRRIEKAWLDLIVEAPRMNAVDLTDLVLSRHPRAQV